MNGCPVAISARGRQLSLARRRCNIILAELPHGERYTDRLIEADLRPQKPLDKKMGTPRGMIRDRAGVAR